MECYISKQDIEELPKIISGAIEAFKFCNNAENIQVYEELIKPFRSENEASFIEWIYAHIVNT